MSAWTSARVLVAVVVVVWVVVWVRSAVLEARLGQEGGWVMEARLGQEGGSGYGLNGVGLPG